MEFITSIFDIKNYSNETEALKQVRGHPEPEKNKLWLKPKELASAAL